MGISQHKTQTWAFNVPLLFVLQMKICLLVHVAHQSVITGTPTTMLKQQTQQHLVDSVKNWFQPVLFVKLQTFILDAIYRLEPSCTPVHTIDESLLLTPESISIIFCYVIIIMT